MKTGILQFGEGNFLRCFIDWMVQRMNDRAGFAGEVRIVQPRGDAPNATSRLLAASGGRYHVCLRGIENGRTVEDLEAVTCVKSVHVAADIECLAVDPALRFVVSNTTEAGIQYVKGADTFPAKVLRLLRARQAAGLPGLVFLPCELVERNGELLRACVLNHLADEADAPDGLRAYIEGQCVFCSTLVDRIVAGRPDPESAERYAQRLGFRDELLVCGEPYHFLAVEAPAGYDLEAELPLRQAGLNVVLTDDLQPYRTRKVRLLNATHTTMARLALERGFSEVAESLGDPSFGAYVQKVVFDEILPTVDLPEDERRAYAQSVLERFANPFAHHRLESIALNTLAKWQTRCLPVVADYYRMFGKTPENMITGFEAIARHYDNLPA